MLNEVTQALTLYDAAWQQLIKSTKNSSFFQALKPVAIGWKVDSYKQYKQAYQQLIENCDLATEVWMNGRWVAKLHLNDKTVGSDVQLVKILQRRPGSKDKIGLDHLDFYHQQTMDEVAKILAAEPGIKWTVENNDIVSGYEWHSIWFNGGEAKLRNATVLDVLQAELSQLNDRIK